MPVIYVASAFGGPTTTAITEERLINRPFLTTPQTTDINILC